MPADMVKPGNQAVPGVERGLLVGQNSVIIAAELIKVVVIVAEVMLPRDNFLGEL